MILSVCLNPALQRTLRFRRFIPGEVNRTGEVTVSAGGKGVLTARIIRQLGGEAAVLGLFGGDTGEALLALLAEERLRIYSVPAPGATRICQTLVDDHRSIQTELVEEGSPVTSETVSQTFSALHNHLPAHRLLVISGTAPSGFTDQTYAAFLEAANAAAVPAVLDASGRLLTESLRHHPVLIKPNRNELENTLGRALRSQSAVHRAMETMVQLGAGSVLITHQDAPVLFLYQEILYKISYPRLPAVNAIGSGDAIAAGFSFHFEESHDTVEAVRYGVACGCANVLTLEAGRVQPGDVLDILPRITIQRTRS